MDLSERIEQLREAKNIRKADMAKALEMDASYYNKFEKRGNKLTVEQLEKIAGVLGVSVIELLTGEAQKVEDSSRVKELEKRVEELEEIVSLLKQEKNRLSHYFFNELQNEIVFNIQYYSIQKWDSLFKLVYNPHNKLGKIIKDVIIKQHHTNKKLAIFSPETACIFNFLLCHTIEEDQEELVGDREEASNTLVNTSSMQKTSEAILEYIRLARIRLKKLSKFEDYYGDNYNALEKFAKQLSIEQEDLLKTKRLLFNDLTIYGYYCELIFTTDGWKFAYKGIKQSLNIISNHDDKALVRSIIHSGIINDQEFLNVFYPNTSISK